MILRIAYVQRVVESALDFLDPHIPFDGRAVQQLLMTVAAEVGGRDIRQQIAGPAISWFQNEPATIEDTRENWLIYRPEILEALEPILRPHASLAEAVFVDPVVAAVFARIKYRRSPLPLADENDRGGQARLWKRAYNTSLGKGTEQHALQNWYTWCHSDNAITQGHPR